MTRYPGVRVIGLTGGIATGKSSIARFLEEHGAAIIDADTLSREVVSPGSPALTAIVAAFGGDMLLPDGTLDRKRLGAYIFADAGKRQLLESIVHPEIRRLSEERIAEAARDHRVIVYMAPLLIEANAVDRVDEVWVVTVNPVTQLQRLMVRDGISREEAQRMIDSQMPLSEKVCHGSVIIDNSGTMEQTRQLLDEIWRKETGTES